MIVRHELFSKMTTPEEMSGYLNHLIKGCQRLIKQKGIPTSHTSAPNRRHEYMTRVNAIYYFISDLTYPDPSGVVDKTIVWDKKLEKVVKKTEITTILIIISIVIFRNLFIPEIFREFNIVFITDATLFITL